MLDELIADYSNSERGMEIREIAGGYRMATKPEYHDAVRGFVKSLKPPMKLSLQALETLAVIAYKQPVTAPEVSEIRGVDSGGVLGGLVSRKLITTAGRKPVIGRPILYKTTKEFLLRFGLKDVNDLPSMEEFEKMAGELAESEAEGEAQDAVNLSSEAVTPAEDAAPVEAEQPSAESSEEVAAASEEDATSPEEATADTEPKKPAARAPGMTATQEQEGERNEQRLQKIVAAAGIASRRKAEELITSGRVQVNGQKVTELGSKADPERDHIRVDGKLLKKPEQFRYFMLNKPKGVVTTVSDPEGRPTVMKFFARAGARVFPVGRLDYQSEGLLLMTNDGELANVLTSAASKVEKTYLVKVSGKPTEAELEQLRRGVMIERGRRGEREGRVMTQPASISLVRDTDNPWYEVMSDRRQESGDPQDVRRNRPFCREGQAGGLWAPGPRCHHRAKCAS